MGREALCNGQLGRESGGVLAQLESHELRIRGDFNATLSFSDLRFARVEGEILEAETPQGHLRLSLGLTEARKCHGDLTERSTCPACEHDGCDDGAHGEPALGEFIGAGNDDEDADDLLDERRSVMESWATFLGG